MSTIQPYSFEPKISNLKDNKTSENRVNRELRDRHGKTDWCKCDECKIVSTDVERRVCVEVITSLLFLEVLSA